MVFRPTCKQSGKVCDQFLVCMLPFVECFRILDFDKILLFDFTDSEAWNGKNMVREYVQLCTRQQIEWRFLSVAFSPFCPNVVFVIPAPAKRRCFA